MTALFMMTLPGGQVRSLTLDVRVWEPSVIGYFQSVGNAFANSIWEEGLSIEGSTRHVSSGQSAERGASNDRGHPAPDIPIVKPDATDPLPVKEKFIQAKVCTRKKFHLLVYLLLALFLNPLDFK
jgi:Arf-GAP/coiled-coil/ANK repeat/PH domain-containing protein